jgi:hypothetical protein
MSTTTETLLPRERQAPQAGLLYRKILLYGDPKVGKSTTASEVGEHPLILDTEGGAAGLDAYVAQVRTWEQFRQTGRELAGWLATGDKPPFDLIVVDTVDVLADQANDYVMRGLAGKREGFIHASDFDYGKGWAAVTKEFQLRVAALCSLGLPVLFVSHAKDAQVKTRTGEITVKRPDVDPKGVRKWLDGFVDLILYAEIRATEDGQQRLLRTAPSENWQAGGRVPRGQSLPDPLTLDGKGLREALSAAVPS